MILPVTTVLVIIFIVWINYEIHKTTKLSKVDVEQFWNREKESNFIRSSEVSDLDYIIITVEQLPMYDHPDSTVNSYRDSILKLSGQKALNLSSYTNTELKLQYGSKNISLLTDCDNNYTVLVSLLQKWAERLYKLGYTKASTAVLEYALACRTDVMKSYLLLADLYKQNGDTDKIQMLIETVAIIGVRNKDKVIQSLSDLMVYKLP